MLYIRHTTSCLRLVHVVFIIKLGYIAHMRYRKKILGFVSSVKQDISRANEGNSSDIPSIYALFCSFQKHSHKKIQIELWIWSIFIREKYQACKKIGFFSDVYLTTTAPGRCSRLDTNSVCILISHFAQTIYLISTSKVSPWSTKVKLMIFWLFTDLPAR